ncbi:NAD(P)/FAD-dependent oxidoreductase [Chloroflexota bacterium]
MLINKTEDVVILGGGVFGFSIAYHLAKEGIRSQVIEMDSIGAKASGKADGMLADAVGSFFYAGSSFSPAGAKPALVALANDSYQRFKQLHGELKEETGLDIQYAICPNLRCALSEQEEDILFKMVSEAKTKGFEVKWISGDDARNLEPLLSEEVRGAILGECGQVEPYRYTLALAQGAEKLGAHIRYAQAVGFRYERDRVTSVILSSGTEVAVGTAIIAMGPWSGQAVSWLGMRLPLKTFRAQTLKLETSKRPNYQAAFRPPAVSEWPLVYMIISRRIDGTMLVGYTEDRPDTWDDDRPDTWIDSPSSEMKELMIEQALHFVPILEEARLIEHRAAVLGNPPSQGMVIGNFPNWQNVYLATIGDNGIEVSPAVGRIMTDLIVGGERAAKAKQEIETVSPQAHGIDVKR